MERPPPLATVFIPPQQHPAPMAQPNSSPQSPGPAPYAPPAPPPPQKAPAAPAAVAAASNKSPRATIPGMVALTPSTGVLAMADRIVLYGPASVGKSTLAAWLPNPYFFESDFGTKKLPVRRDPFTTFTELRGKLASFAAHPVPGVQSVVVECAEIEMLIREFVVQERTNEKGVKVNSIEGFGWNKGMLIVAEEFDGFVADLDRIVAKGIYVCLVFNDALTEIINPDGVDYMQYQPLLYAGDKQRRGSMRDRIRNWCDYMLFIGFDVAVNKEGKATGSGTRTIYTYQTAGHMAKTRTKALNFSFKSEDPGAIWRELELRYQG